MTGREIAPLVTLQPRVAEVARLWTARPRCVFHSDFLRTQLRCRPTFYPGRLSWKMGSSSDMAMPPTMTPMMVIMIGSIMLVVVLIEASTSWS